MRFNNYNYVLGDNCFAYSDFLKRFDQPLHVETDERGSKGLYFTSE